MKKGSIFLLLFTSLLTTLISCENSMERIEDWDENEAQNFSGNIEDLIAKEGFDFQTTKNIELKLTATNSNQTNTTPSIGIEVYSIANDQKQNLLSKGNIRDSDGWIQSLTVPEHLDSITIKVTTPGFPQWHRVAAKNGQLNYQLGGSNPSGRIIQDPPVNEEENIPLVNSAQLGARSGYAYMGSVNSLGVPDYLTSSTEITSSMLDFIAVNLPEEQPVPEYNPQYLESNISSNVIFKEDGDLWVSFIHEGAGYRNAIGYFTFDPNNPPETIAEIDSRTILFPNTSYEYSGGGLKTGDRIYLGHFEQGTGVGWFLVPNGWNSSTRTVNESSTTRYSFEELNTFTSPENRSHCLLLTNTVDEFHIVTFEDLNRPYGDNDFNDAVFLVEANPFSAINTDNTPPVVIPGNDEDGDGVIDIMDTYPLDDERAYASYAPGQNNFGTIAFEDLWPRKGDYDFNDMVVNYSFIEILDAQMRVKDIELSMQVSAMGASQNHGFALQLPVSQQMIESVSGQIITDDYFALNSNGTESGMNNAVVPIFTDGFSLFETVDRGGIINTMPGKPKVNAGNLQVKITFSSPIDRELIGSPPYDPFLLRKQDRSLEIHLAGHPPTERADLSIFNTDDDRSDLENNFHYVDSKNLPWAIHMPESFLYPKERIPITMVYKDFSEWAIYGGESNINWFINNGFNIVEENSY